MIDNPNPKKYRIKKIRGKGFILVDRQIDRWKKLLKPTEIPKDPNKRKLGRPKNYTKPKGWGMFE